MPPSISSQPPYNLPDSWIKSKANLDLKTPLNFVSTRRHYRRKLRFTYCEQEG